MKHLVKRDRVCVDGGKSTTNVYAFSFGIEFCCIDD